MNKLEIDLYDALEKVFMEFSKREDFDEGHYCSALTHHCIELNYDLAENPINAARYILTCWAAEMEVLNDKASKKHLAWSKSLH